MDMLCLMSECEDRGVLASGGVPWDRNEIAVAVGGDLAENLACIEELLLKGVACLTKLGAVSNKRMVRDEEKRADNRNRQHNFRNSHKTNKNSNADVTPMSQPSSSSSSSSSLKTNTKTATPQAAFVLPDWVPVEPWEAFVKMRTRIRAPLSDRAKQGIVRDLDRLRTIGNDIGEVLDRSEKNAWRGVFALPGPEPDRRKDERFTPGPDRYKKPGGPQ